jgi:hypothetical protein
MGKATPLAASALAAKMSCTYTGICIYKVAGMVLNGSPAPMGIPFGRLSHVAKAAILVGG